MSIDQRVKPAQGKELFVEGTTLFAAIVMILVGGWQAFLGIVSLLNDEFLVVSGNWVAKLDLTAWGWFHLLLGVLLVVTGFFLFRPTTWARVVGIIAVSVAALANFLWLPYAPVWGTLIIVADIVVIWALATYGRHAN